MEEQIEILEKSQLCENDQDAVAFKDTFSWARLEHLLNKDNLELAHEILSLRIQAEDQKKGIKLLRETLIEMKENIKLTNLNHQEALIKAKTEAENLIQRHQKFIKQILNEKKILNEMVEKSVLNLKQEEQKFKKNMKAVKDRHAIEIKRAKEAQFVSDKVRRKKWMEIKIKKIKEMTVKGLEPEISRMISVQEQEILDLKKLYKSELEAIELKAARRTSALMDQLRTDLIIEKENAVEREVKNVISRLETNFEEERKKFEIARQKLKDQLLKEQEKFITQEAEFHRREEIQKKESDKERQKLIEDFEQQFEKVRQQHSMEMKNFKATVKEEMEAWKDNYKKQESNRFAEKEAELHLQYKKSRDKEIEVVIEKLEKETAQVQAQMNEASENKLKRLKESLENEIKILEENETALRDKLSNANVLILEKEESITKLNSQTEQLQAELTFSRQCCEDIGSTKKKLRKIIQKEFNNRIRRVQNEKEELKKKILNLKKKHTIELEKKDHIACQAKNEIQKELVKVYGRIKMAAEKKDIIIESQRKEYEALQNKCHQLEVLLEKQRKNLLLQ